MSFSHSKKETCGILFLTLSGLFVKVCGLLFKIPLTALIGEEGMGYFNAAYTLFTWLYMIATAGLPTAVAMMISRAEASGCSEKTKKIFKVSLALFFGLGICGSAILFFGADFFASLMEVERSYLSILAIAPTLFFICQSASLRGYFQGIGNLYPHAVSQIFEALGKLLLGVTLARIALDHGAAIHEAAAFATLGLTVGVAAGAGVLWLSYLFARRKMSPESSLSCEKMPTRPILHRLLVTALPITLSGSVMSLANLIDTFIMTRRLNDIGFSQAETVAVYGNYSSLALPMFNLPAVIVYPLAYALMPTISSLLEKKQIGKATEKCRETLKLTLLVAFPCAFGLAVFSEPILALFFDSEIAARGAGMLTLLAPSSLLLCLLAVTNTVLQASGQERLPLYAMLVGVGVKLAGSYFLIPVFGKYGTPLSTFLCYFAIIAVSAFMIETKTPLGDAFRSREFFSPALIGFLTVGGAVICYRLSGKILPTLAIAAVIYLPLVLKFGGLPAQISEIFKKRKT